MIAWTLLLAPNVARAHAPVTYEAGPDDWCEVLASIPGGDFVALAPGDYTGPCVVVGKLNESYPGDYTTIVAADSSQPPVLHGDGVADVVLDVSGQQVLVSGFVVVDIPAGVTAIRLHDGTNLQARFLTMTGIDGTAVSVAQGATSTRVSENRVTGGSGTAFEVGCVPECAPEATEIAHNFVSGVATGTRIRGGATVWLHDEVVADAVSAVVVEAGAGATTTIELSLFHASATALDISAPSLLRNLIVLAGTTRLAGSGITLTGSTLLGSLDPAGLSSGSAVRNLALADAAPVVPAGAVGEALVACPDPDLCWLDAATWDLFPVADGPLANTGVTDADLTGDWCSRARGDANSPGALESIGTVGMGPIELVPRYEFDCRLDPEPGDTGLPPITYTRTDTGIDTPPEPPPGDTAEPEAPTTSSLSLDRGCTCGGGQSALIAPFALAWAARVRRGRSGSAPRRR